MKTISNISRTILLKKLISKQIYYIIFNKIKSLRHRIDEISLNK